MSITTNNIPKVTFTSKEGKTTKGLLLAKFSIEPVSQSNTKSSRMQQMLNNDNSNNSIDYVMVFIPYKNRLKELCLIKKSNVLTCGNFNDKNVIKANKYMSMFNLELPYTAGFNIRNFEGYNFICNNNSFIANLYEGCENNCLDILSHYIPDIFFAEYEN